MKIFNKMLYYWMLFYFLTNVLSVESMQWYCKTNADCTAPNSVCSTDYLCECKDGQVISSDGKYCYPIAESPDYKCVDDKQCSELIFGPVECLNNECSCAEGYRLLGESCVKANGLNEPCSEDIDCYDGINFGSMKCDNGKCICNTGFYERDKIDCRPNAKVTGKCFFDLDCQSETEFCDFGYGPTGTCKPKKYYQDREKVVHDIPEVESYEINDIPKTCKSDKDCLKAGMENAFCALYLEKCRCKSGFIYDKKTNSCITALGEKCTAPSGIKNSDCIDGINKCNDFYIEGYMNHKCYKPCRNIGFSCIHDRNCHSFSKHSVCVMNKCACDSSSKFDDRYMLCRQVTTGSSGDSCTVPQDCYKKPFSTCENQKCVCLPGYYEERGKCFAKLGTDCSPITGECAIDNAQCIKFNCTCIENYMPNGETCVRILKDIEQENCIADIQCSYYWGKGAICEASECTCSSNYTLIDTNDFSASNKTCALKKYYGDFCTSSRDCTIHMEGKVMCLNSRCSCDYGAKPNPNGTYCTSNAFVQVSSKILLIFFILFTNYWN